jgi:excisionase family DNA binding protein
MRAATGSRSVPFIRRTETYELSRDELTQLVADAVGDALAELPGASPWLDVDGAANYLSTTASAIRAMVKRGKLPVHRTPNGRLLFDPTELRAWVLSGGDPH